MNNKIKPKSLIGKKIQWSILMGAFSRIKTGTVEDVQGKNLFLKNGDVVYLSDLHDFKVVDDVPVV